MIKQFIRVPMLSSDVCEHWLLQALLLKQYWIKRRHDVPFYTLGLAAYLDDNRMHEALIGKSYLETEISHNNMLMQRYFAQLYQELADRLSTFFNLTARFNLKHLALPGFHIYQSHQLFAKSVVSVHRVLQYQRLFGRYGYAACRDVVTFTLPISIPQKVVLNIFTPSGEKQLYPYHQGELVLHSGLQSHQAVINCFGVSCERITLQGHGFRHNDTMILYW